MEWLIHIANLLYLSSYLVRDILWLRLFTIAAGSLLTVFYFNLDEPLYAAIAWNLIFITINVYQSFLRIKERQPVALTSEEQILYQLVFRSMKPRDFKNLINLGKWENLSCEQILVKEGHNPERIYVIAKGSISIEKEHKRIAVLQPGQFLGEFGFLTGNCASANAVITENSKVISWKFEALRKFLESNTSLKASLQLIIGHDLIRKINGSQK